MPEPRRPTYTYDDFDDPAETPADHVYYCAAFKNASWRLLLGPFPTLAEAKASLKTAMARAEAVDPFWSYYTYLPVSLPAGVRPHVAFSPKGGAGV